PALQATRVDVMYTLKDGKGERRGRRGLSRFTLRQVLLASQIAISLLLVTAAGLFVRTLQNLQSREIGFRRENILLFNLNAWQAGHREPEILSLYEDIAKRLATIPGVRSATLANSALIGDAWAWPVVPQGKMKPEHAPSGYGSGMAPTATRVLATGLGFFRTMQIPILAGREFDERDHLGSPPVAIVNEAWVKVNQPGQNPVGQRVMSFGLRGKPQEMEIIGLAKNARYGGFRGDYPAIVYMPFEQNLNAPVREITFFLRAAGDPLASAGAIREIVRQADSRIAITHLMTQSAEINQQMTQEVLFARLCILFAILALAIACVGLYATMSYLVARRTSEIGIRIALGASRSRVVWMVIRHVIAVT